MEDDYSMKQGGKSMWALVAPGFPRLRTGVALLAFAALAALSAAILPASVAAQAADDEYSLNIPGASSGGGSSHQSSAGTATTAGGDTEPSAPTSAAEAATVTEQGSGNSGGGNGTDSGGGTKGRANGSGQGAGDGPGANVTATPANLDTPPAAAVDSDDSGAPILLIGLAAIAALCTAVAIWRLRQRSDDEEHGIDRNTATAAGVTGET